MSVPAREQGDLRYLLYCRRHLVVRCLCHPDSWAAATYGDDRDGREVG